MTDATSPTVVEPARLPWWRRWWRQITAAVLSAGALAGAVEAVVGLLPKDPPRRAAQIQPAPDVRWQVPLSEYREREDRSTPGAAAPVPHVAPRVRLRLAAVAAELSTAAEPVSPSSSPTSADVQPPPVTTSTSQLDVPTSPSDTTTTSPPPSDDTSTTHGNTTSEPEDSQRTAEVPTSSAVASATATSRSAKVQRRARTTLRRDVLPRVRRLAPDVALPKVLPESVENLMARSLTNPQPTAAPASGREADLQVAERLVTSKDAAKRLVRLLENTRKERGHGRRRQLLGVEVEANLELTGFRNEDVTLAWSILRADGGHPLPGTWLREVPARLLRARADDETADVTVWVPLPRKKGQYLVRVRLYDGEDRPLSSQRTRVFR